MISEEQNKSLLLTGVLAGSKSKEWEQLKDLLELAWKRTKRYFAAGFTSTPFCDEVFISCRQDQLKISTPVI